MFQKGLESSLKIDVWVCNRLAYVSLDCVEEMRGWKSAICLVILIEASYLVVKYEMNAAR